MKLERTYYNFLAYYNSLTSSIQQFSATPVLDDGSKMCKVAATQPHKFQMEQIYQH